jgi:gas vesicle protein
MDLKEVDLSKLSLEEIGKLGAECYKKVREEKMKELKQYTEERKKHNLSEIHLLFQNEIKEKIKNVSNVDEIRELINEVKRKKAEKGFDKMTCEETENFLQNIRGVLKNKPLDVFKKGLSVEECMELVKNKRLSLK